MTATQLQLQQHPLSAAYPKMEQKEFDALVQDIAAHGQLHDCVTLDGMVLDGMTRYRACLAAGVECRFVEYDGTDPRAFVESVNGHRRHLAPDQRSESQRAVAAVLECASWSKRGRPKQTGTGAGLNEARDPITEPGEITTSKQIGHVTHLTNRQLAEQTRTSVETIKRIKRAVRAGHGDAVSAGKMTANQAAKPQRGQVSIRTVRGQSDLAKALEWQLPPTPWNDGDLRAWADQLKKLESLIPPEITRAIAELYAEGMTRANFAEGAHC